MIDDEQLAADTDKAWAAWLDHLAAMPDGLTYDEMPEWWRDKCDSLRQQYHDLETALYLNDWLIT